MCIFLQRQQYLQQIMQAKNLEKKKSLFSQRIKQARLNNPVQQDPFPKAVNININVKQICNQEPIRQQHIQKNNQSQNIDNNQNFVQRMLGSVLKQDDVKKIQDQNMKAIMQMSEEQVKKYQQLIASQFPQQFLKKLKKNVPIKKQQQKQQIKQNIKEQQKKKENIAHQQGKMEKGKEEHIQIKQNNQKEQITEQNQPLGTLSHLHIDIKNAQVMYIPPQLKFLNYPQQILSMISLKQMIESQNNQTQIIGCKLLKKLSNKIFGQFCNPKIPSCIPLIKISGEEFHLILLAFDLFRFLLRSVMFQANKTQFKTCWLEEIETIIQCVCLMEKWFTFGEQGQQYVKQLLQFLKMQIVRKNKFFSQSNSQQQVYEKIFVQKIQKITTELSQTPKIQEIPCQKYLTISSQFSSQFVNLFRIEQLATQANISKGLPFHTLLYRIAAQSYSYYESQLQALRKFLIQLVYPIALELLRRDLKSNGMNGQVQVLKAVVYQWLLAGFGQIPAAVACTYKIIQNNQQESYIFKCLQITKILSISTYVKSLQSLPSLSQLNNSSKQCHQETIINMLNFLNLQQYFKNSVSSLQQKTKDIQNIQLMMDFMTNRFIWKQNNYLKNIVEFVFIDFVSIFYMYTGSIAANVKQNKDGPKNNHNKQEQFRITYQDIKEQLLDSLLDNLCKLLGKINQPSSYWSLLPEQKIKSLISSYNYDSLGNYCFTKLLIFLLATCPYKNIQVLLIEQVLSRYPFLFYYAAKNGLYGPQQIYLKSSAIQQFGAIYDILKVSNKIEQNNLFIKYLCKK